MGGWTGDKRDTRAGFRRYLDESGKVIACAPSDEGAREIGRLRLESDPIADAVFDRSVLENPTPWDAVRKQAGTGSRVLKPDFPTKDDIRHLEVNVRFARDDRSRVHFERELDLAKVLAATKFRNPRHRPLDRERIKDCARQFEKRTGAIWDSLSKETRDPRVGVCAIDACKGRVGVSNVSNAYDKILHGFALMREDREGTDWMFVLIDLITINRRPRRGREES
jgi:hypothetical protein